MGGGLTRELCFFVFVVVVFITEGILELFVCLFFRVKKVQDFFLKAQKLWMNAGNAIISDSNVLDVSTEFLEEALEKNPC